MGKQREASSVTVDEKVEQTNARIYGDCLLCELDLTLLFLYGGSSQKNVALIKRKLVGRISKNKF